MRLHSQVCTSALVRQRSGASPIRWLISRTESASPSLRSASLRLSSEPAAPTPRRLRGTRVGATRTLGARAPIERKLAQEVQVSAARARVGEGGPCVVALRDAPGTELEPGRGEDTAHRLAPPQ